MSESLKLAARVAEQVRLDLLGMDGGGTGLAVQSSLLRSVAVLIEAIKAAAAESGPQDCAGADPNRAKVIYLAGPYSHPDAAIRAERARRLTEVAAGLVRDHGLAVLSPITMGHQYAVIYPDLPYSYDHHRAVCEAMMRSASVMVIFAMDGLADSVGVRREAAFFKGLGRDIKVLTGDGEAAVMVPFSQWEKDGGWGG